MANVILFFENARMFVKKISMRPFSLDAGDQQFASFGLAYGFYARILVGQMLSADTFSPLVVLRRGWVAFCCCLIPTVSGRCRAFAAWHLHLYEGIIDVRLHFREGIIPMSAHFYEGMLL